MTHSTPEVIKAALTPAQAADVICYYDVSENEAAYANNWREPKIALGLVAIHTTQSRHSIMPNEDAALAYTEPTLTKKEASEGLEYLLNEKDSISRPTPEAKSENWPIEPTDVQLKLIEDMADKIPCSYTEAYAKVMGIWPN